MAYKFQLGQAQMSGTLIQEGDFKINNEAGSTVTSFGQDGVLSGSGAGKFGSLHVNSSEIISSAGAVANVTSIDGSGDLTMGTITMTGFSVDADGDTALKSLAVDDGSTIGPDSVTDLITLAADGDITIKDGAYDFDIAAHDGSNGLKLGGVLVTSTAAELNLVDGITAGTVAASKAVIVDSNKDISGFRNVTATGYFEIGSAQLTEAEMEQIDGITAGTAAASKAVVLDAQKDITGINNITASYFKGDGSALTNVDAVTKVTSSAGNLGYELAFTEYLGNDVELGGNAGLTFNPAGAPAGNGFSGSLFVSASDAGVQMSRLVLGSKDDGVLKYQKDGSDLVFGMFTANAGIDISASNGGGVVLAGGDSAGTIVKGDGMFFVQKADETTVASINGSSGVISGSNNLTLYGDVISDGKLDIKAADSKIAATDTEIADGDSLYFLDATDSNKIKKDSVADLAALFAGDGLAAASSVIAVANATNGGIGVQANDIKLDFNDLSAADVSVANDSIAIIDADDSNGTRKESIADLVSAMAGAGLTATNGVLSADSAAAPALKADGETLQEGYNYLADLNANATVSLPASPSVGDVVHVKAADLNSGANVIIQRNAGAGSHTIDDDHTSVRIESSFGAVSLVYVVANKWRLV